MKVRGVFNLLYLTVVLSYMIYPRWLAWAGLPLPLWTRWVGAVLALAAIPLTAWVQWALGKNFSSTLHIREGHTLVTRGPYRWVRHPMYTVLFTFSIGILLLTANWVIGVPLAVVLGLVIWSRMNKEEAMLIEQFGEDYREYMRRTGRFFPRIV